jgi:2,5-diketo-D-gluconate reductase A
MSTVSTVPAIELNDANPIPQLGFGVFQVEPSETARAVATALDIGYRHIDTAQMYGNERGVGEAIRALGLPRGEVFVTSKLNNGFHRPDDARRAFDGTLYGGDFVSTWQVLEELAAEGRARSIGVSNFQVAHLERLVAECDVVPAVNQVELHPYFANAEVHACCDAHGIAVEAWAPIAQGKVLGDRVIGEIAQTVGRTPAQVVLRWHIQHGHIVFPKSVTPARVAENFAIFDFALDADAMARIDALDRGEAGRNGPNPDTFDYIPR